MKITYVGDNTCRNNWGCRATSAALKELLDSKFEISHIINGNYIDFNNKCLLKKNNDKYIDYLTDNIDNNLNNLLKNKNKYENIDFIINAILDCDAVVVNSEGSFIFTDPPRRDTLFFLMINDLAFLYKKPIHFVNGMLSFDPDNKCNKSIFEATLTRYLNAKFVSVRDLTSLNYLEKSINSNHNKNFKYIPDALFTWNKKYLEGSFNKRIDDQNILIDFSSPYICVGGSSLAAKNQNLAASKYISLVNMLKKLDIKIILVQTCDGDHFLRRVASETNTQIVPVTIDIFRGIEILAGAKLFVSGRYHPSIMASFGGSPCIFLKSNSHKTLSLQQILKYQAIKEFSAYPSTDECEEILSDAQTILEQVPHQKETIKNTVRELSEHAKTIINYINL